jgi:hypothetical protein
VQSENRSPHDAKRSEGNTVQADHAFPDFATLHPGYACWGWGWDDSADKLCRRVRPDGKRTEGAKVGEIGKSIIGAPSIFITAAAIASGALSGTSVAVASYVYLKFPHPAGIQHVAVPEQARTSTYVESIESYLFAIPCLQVVIFLGLALAALRWRAVVRRLAAREARYATKYPSLRSSNSVQGYKVVMALMVIFEALMLFSTAYRSVMLTTNNIG